ncbi:heptosyltransferase III [Methylococcales bacterium]|nr:heptosyltransferase III [Methylococcales bacterium]
MQSYLKDKVDFSQVQRVLVIKLQHLGDVLLTSPVFSTLKRQYPHLEIDALVYADTACMLEGNPHISKILTIDRAWKEQTLQKVIQEFRLYRLLKQRNYQLLIGLTDRMRAAWLARLLGPTYSVAQKYPHKRGEFWRNSFSHVYSQPQTPRHTVETHLDALRRIGLYPLAENKPLLMPINTVAVNKISSLLESENLQAGHYIVIHPASRWMFKSWNTRGFAKVLQALTSRNIATVMVSGPDAAECNYVQTILRHQPNTAIDLSGQLSLPELAALIAKARCFIGLDSVAMHIAAAVDTPCVALFGPSSEQSWHPWHVHHRILTSPFSCRPCGLDGCGNGKISDCLQAIQADAVIQATLSLIGEPRA